MKNNEIIESSRVWGGAPITEEDKSKIRIIVQIHHPELIEERSDENA